MLNDKKDDIFLSRWMNKELSKEEIQEFKLHPEYKHYIKIIAGADALDLKKYDIEKELSNLKSKKQDPIKNKPNLVIKFLPYLTIAASIVIILGIFLFNPNTSFHSNYGEQLTVTLPDGSEMILNAKSTASFNTKKWKENRILVLDGEAFFKVKKGSKFTVNTKNGKISVLGTQFNVQSQNDFFEVTCYEGKVTIAYQKQVEILTAGKGYRNLKNIQPKSWSFIDTTPSWLSNTSSFKSIPLKYVFKELEEQYNLQIKTVNIDLETIYTGTFPNNNKDIALKTVFNTLGIEYRISQDDGKTVILE
ncbi:FecR family protein [Aquimarina muelleri]|uniref:Anti-sigma factor n=1 Tax=Aquimarina muelleri TaxID=279356 RepID=A0A918JX67_9FLAO|nr:FecR family protein [Aquimarina muelleri]MCX2761793.1 FecR family protein [Aquimarina muelleri]GGX23256.1 anti-sigma factor [Aquimarina muelleri]